MKSKGITIIQRVETFVTLDYEDSDDLQEQIDCYEQVAGIMQDGEVTDVQVWVNDSCEEANV